MGETGGRAGEAAVREIAEDEVEDGKEEEAEEAVGLCRSTARMRGCATREARRARFLRY